MSASPQPWHRLLATVDLRSPRAHLRRLQPADLEPLWAVAQAPQLWAYSLQTVAHRADFERYVATALEEQAQGLSCPLVLADAQGRWAGMTRLGNLAPAHHRLEIGWTWVGLAWQRTGLNRAAKGLLLEFCFGPLGCRRVEFKANAQNAASRRALEGIGAQYEGCLRQHMESDGGVVRDTVYYSILAEEWPGLRARLLDPLV